MSDASRNFDAMISHHVDSSDSEADFDDVIRCEGVILEDVPHIIHFLRPNASMCFAGKNVVFYGKKYIDVYKGKYLEPAGESLGNSFSVKVSMISRIRAVCSSRDKIASLCTRHAGEGRTGLLINIYDANTGEKTISITPRFINQSAAIAFHPFGNALACVSSPGYLDVYGSKTGNHNGRFKLEMKASSISLLSFSPDSSKAVFLAGSNQIMTIDTKTMKVDSSHDFKHTVTSLSLSNDNRIIIGTEFDATIMKCVSSKYVIDHKFIGYSAVFSPDSTRIAVCGLDVYSGNIGIYDAKSYELQFNLIACWNVLEVVFSDDSKQLLGKYCARDDHRVKTAGLWNILPNHFESIYNFRNNAGLIEPTEDYIDKLDAMRLAHNAIVNDALVAKRVPDRVIDCVYEYLGSN